MLAQIPGQAKKNVRKLNINYSEHALRLDTTLTTIPAKLFIGQENWALIHIRQIIPKATTLLVLL